MTLTPGFRLGSYEVVSLVGSGGMGEVYRARDAKLGREVAVKILVAAYPRRRGRERGSPAGGWFARSHLRGRRLAHAVVSGWKALVCTNGRSRDDGANRKDVRSSGGPRPKRCPTFRPRASGRRRSWLPGQEYA